jgi:hypothetical protein
LSAADILAQAQSEPNKTRLREETETARARGVFGAPTFFVGSEARRDRPRMRRDGRRLRSELPILLAPMARACPPALSIAVANAGGMGACGALLLKPEAIAEWQRAFSSGSNRAVQLNLWIPDPAPVRNRAQHRHELCRRRDEVRCAASRALPCTARFDRGNARNRPD